MFFLFLVWDCDVSSSSLDNTTELPVIFGFSVGVFSAASACHPEGSGWLSSDESAAPSASLFSLEGPASFASDGTGLHQLMSLILPFSVARLAHFFIMQAFCCSRYCIVFNANIIFDILYQFSSTRPASQPERPLPWIG